MVSIILDLYYYDFIFIIANKLINPMESTSLAWKITFII